MGDITNNISLPETTCRCGCHTHLNHNIKDNIVTLAYEIQKFITILSLIYQEEKIIVLFKWGQSGGSWVRCKDYNKEVGGAENSIHPLGLAADPQFFRKKQTHNIQINPIGICRVALVASRQGLLNFRGIGCYRTFSHLDLRNDPPVQWVVNDNKEYHYGHDFKNVNFG